MGASISRLRAKETYYVLIFGAAMAGKTQLLTRKEFGKVVSTVSTSGFPLQVISHGKRVRLVTREYGSPSSGGDEWVWTVYAGRVDATIFVVDSTDRNSIDKAICAAHRVMRLHRCLADRPCLVFANKKDLPDALPLKELSRDLKPEELGFENWKMFSSDAINDDGVDEGLDWLVQELRSNK